MKRAITNAGKINTGTRKITAKKPWVTEEILQLIDKKKEVQKCSRKFRNTEIQVT